MSNFAISGKSIKNPSGFKIERYNITTLNRLANGNMVGDLVAKKRKFFFTYESLEAADLNDILSAIWDTNNIFFTLDYVENNIAHKAEVYAGSIPSDLHRASPSGWVWKGVNFNLIER